MPGAGADKVVVVVGGGPAGVNMALALARAGYAVEIAEPDPGAAERARAFLNRAGADLRVTEDLGGIDRAAILFEALDEEPKLRQDMLRDLLARAPQGALLLSTSPAQAGGRVIRFQMYAPAHLRTLVEITPGPAAPPAQVDAAFALARRLNKHPVAAPFGRASIGTRLTRRLYEAADTLLMDGAIPHELDEAMVDFGWDMGVYEAQDLIGLAQAYGDRKAQAARRDPARRYIPISDRMVEEGRLGKVAGVGWYRYPGGGGAVIDPLVEDLVREEAWFAGVTQREFTAQEVQERLVLALIHEGVSMLMDGTARQAADIDLVSVAGLGFPARRGGVIAYADARGIEWVSHTLTQLAEEDPVVWTPPALILRCARTGTRLSDAV